MSNASEQSVRSAAITGASGGLGRDIALGLAAKGYVVFGTALKSADVQEMKEASGGRVSLSVCNITKEEDVKAWVAGSPKVLPETPTRSTQPNRRRAGARALSRCV
jgi:NAD(P)-dependent dehydrogenase (short-subunit alcohol dehydrogenase family)